MSNPKVSWVTARQTYWDAALNNRAAVAGSHAWFAEWRDRSRHVRERPGARLDCRIAPAPRACLDWLPAGSPGRPTVAFVHGGYWQSGSKEDFTFVAEGLLQHDINVAMLGYSLAPAERLGSIVAEIAVSCRALLSRLTTFTASADVVLVGWSAGAHLTAMQLGQVELAGAVLISGIYDLVPVQRCYLNAALNLTERDIDDLSPLRHPPQKPPPLIFSYGALELPELQRQTEDCAATWLQAGIDLKVSIVPAAHHYSILESLARPDGQLLAQILDLLGR